MAKCETCGNDYQNSLHITINGESHTFDCFECAIQGLAPRCQQCNCPIIGHGVEISGKVFCCANCARGAGYQGLCDNEAVLKL